MTLRYEGGLKKSTLWVGSDNKGGVKGFGHLSWKRWSLCESIHRSKANSGKVKGGEEADFFDAQKNKQEWFHEQRARAVYRISDGGHAEGWSSLKKKEVRRCTTRNENPSLEAQVWSRSHGGQVRRYEKGGSGLARNTHRPLDRKLLLPLRV